MEQILFRGVASDNSSGVHPDILQAGIDVLPFVALLQGTLGIGRGIQ